MNPIDQVSVDSAQGAATTGATEAHTPQWSWVPIRSLGPRHHDRIVAHLLSLDESDRYLRFGYRATDAQIALRRHASTSTRTEVFGVFNPPPRTDRHGAPGPSERPADRRAARWPSSACR